LWEFEVADEARARADKLLAEDLTDADRNLQLFSKRVNPSEKGALSIQSVQQA
jgi:hypothetical protein